MRLIDSGVSYRYSGLYMWSAVIFCLISAIQLKAEVEPTQVRTPDGISIPIISSNTFVVTTGSGTWAVVQSGNFTVTPSTGVYQVNLSTIQSYNIGTTTITTNGASIPITSSNTLVVTAGSGTWTVVQTGNLTVTPSTGVYQGNLSTIQSYNIGTTTITTNGASIPITSSNTFMVNLTSGSALSPLFFVSTGIPSIAISSGLWNYSQAIAARCVNSAGTAFEACGGASSANATVYIASGNVSASSVSLRAAGTDITATGTSLNVNCTGGCGSPSQTGTYIAASTHIITTSTIPWCILNNGDSLVTLKIRKITVQPYGPGAITGLVSTYDLFKTSVSPTNGSTVTLNAITFMDTNDSALNSKIIIRNVPTVPLNGQGSHISMGFASISGEETTLQFPTPIYEYKNTGDKPLTIRAGQGSCLRQSAVGNTVGVVGVQCIFTQE